MHTEHIPHIEHLPAGGGPAGWFLKPCIWSPSNLTFNSSWWSSVPFLIMYLICSIVIVWASCERISLTISTGFCFFALIALGAAAAFRLVPPFGLPPPREVTQASSWIGIPIFSALVYLAVEGGGSTKIN